MQHNLWHATRPPTARGMQRMTRQGLPRHGAATVAGSATRRGGCIVAHVRTECYEDPAVSCYWRLCGGYVTDGDYTVRRCLLNSAVPKKLPRSSCCCLVGTAIVPHCAPMPVARRSGAYGASRCTWRDGAATERAPAGKLRLGPGVRAESAHTRRPARGPLPSAGTSRPSRPSSRSSKGPDLRVASTKHASKIKGSR
jgi:hypothetical protein